MPESRATDAWVFHAGALGDFVMIWPLLRSLTHAHRRVHVVADASKAALAADCIGAAIVPHDVQRREFTQLWTGAAAPTSLPVSDASLVVNFVAHPCSNPRWCVAAQAMFPNAAFRDAGPPASESRRLLWQEMNVEEWGGAPPASSLPAGAPGATILCHVGAGSSAKRWPMSHWVTLSQMLTRPVTFIAGEVEAEQFSEAERALFRSLDGRVCVTLQELTDFIRAASVFIGADSGPTHLAAQLGVQTLALFGPTDPAIWSPVGPQVRVIAPTPAASMEWLSPRRVSDEVFSLL